MGNAKSKKSRRFHGPDYPFVLVHGLLGFGTIGFRRKLQYFRGVMHHLEGNKEVLNGKAKVYVADLDPVDSISSRAIQLRDFIQSRIYDESRDKFRYEKVHVIAHSMGGLDARYMVSNLSLDTGDLSPMSERVASLTTIGTPHLGTPFADFMERLPVAGRTVQLARLYSISLPALEQLSVRYLVKEGYGDRMPDREGVQYYAYAGEVSPLRLFPPLLPSAEIIRRSEEGGPNDGLVPVASARFHYPAIDEEVEQVIEADHAAQVGHGYGIVSSALGRAFQHLPFYAHIADTLGRKAVGPSE